MRLALREHLALFQGLAELSPQVEALSDRMAGCIRVGGKIILMGNSGSAADCQHIASELVEAALTEGA